MRYAAPEKLEIIRLVEQSPLPVRHTLAKLGIPRATFYRWYDRHSRGGPEALNDRSPRPDRVWNRIPDSRKDGAARHRKSTRALCPRGTHRTLVHRRGQDFRDCPVRTRALGGRRDAFAEDEDLAASGSEVPARLHGVDAVDPEYQAIVLGLVAADKPEHHLG